MSKNRNYLPEDWLEIFINRVRSEGVWCDTKVTDTLRHKFVCRNPKASIAISLCGTIIVPFEKLHENVITKKCLICELYDVGSKEVQERILARHDETLDKLSQTQNQNQEQ
jgi:hypothetical protein